MQATSYPTQPGVPGQTVYVHQPAPVNYSTTVQNPNSSAGTSPRFNGKAGRATGWIQLALGIGSIVVAIAELVLVTSIGYAAMGIWASILFYIPTAILGICTMQKNTCVIIAYLTMCIITANVAFGQMIAGAIGAGVIGGRFRYDCDYFGYSRYCEPSLYRGQIAADALLAILGLIEMIVAIVGSAYCCGGMACGSPTTTTTTVYTQQTTPMVVTTGQFTQPQGIAQPPPAYNVQHAYPPAGQPAAPVAPAPYNQAAAPAYNPQAAAAPNKPVGMVA